MSLTILKNTNLSTSRGRQSFVIPSNSGLLALHMFGGDNASDQETFSKRNYALGSNASATVTGVPDYSSTGVTLNTQKSFDHTSITEPTNCTFFWIGRIWESDLSSTNQDPQCIGWGGDGKGAMLYAVNNDQYRLGGIFPTVSSNFEGAIISANHGTLQMIAGTIEDGVGVKLYNLTEGTTELSNITAPRGSGDGETLSIGGNYSGNNPTGGANSVVAAAAWDVVLPTSEVIQMGEWFRSIHTEFNGSAPTW